jgi:alpha-L-rhamnosidase
MGRSDLALTILFKESYPSWFFSINQGATTMWERWNSYSHKDGFGAAGMNSFNHYAYGAIGQWMYERVAGLAPDPANPGYKHFFVRPLIAPQLEHARAELETAYGKASSGWKKEEGKIVMDVVVPPNTTATIEFPNGRKTETVSAGSYRFELENQ